MNALQRARAKYERRPEPAPADSENLVPWTAKTDKGPSVSSVSPQDQVFGIVERLEELRAARGQRVLAMLAAAPESQTHFWVADDKAHPEFIVLLLAIRDVGTCELSIPREKYDAFEMLEVLGRG